MNLYKTFALGSLATAAIAAGDPPPSYGPPAPLTLGSSSQFEVEAARPDLHGPIGVLGEHPLVDGTWQFSYRYVREDFGGLQDGKSDLSNQDVFDQGFESTPSSHTREKHLFTALYGYSEDLSLLITIPWISNAMKFTDDTGGNYNVRTIGLGDLMLTGLYKLREKEDGSVHLNLGVSLPTGSHAETDILPGSGGNTAKLPYPMQPGSGTVDLAPGVTWVHLDEETSWGAQLTQVLRFDKNSDGYGLGNESRITAWVARQFREDLSGSLRMAWEHVEDYTGQDDELDPSLDPSQDPHAQGGDRLNLFMGVNYTRPGGHRFAGELGGPVFQDLNGPQLSTDIIYMVGWQFSF